MDMQIASFIIRILLLQILAITSEMALTKRLWGLGVFLVTVWLTVFRLAFLRAVSLYMGVFGKPGEVIFTDKMRDWLVAGQTTNIFDILMLLGALFMAYRLHKNFKDKVIL